MKSYRLFLIIVLILFCVVLVGVGNFYAFRHVVGLTNQQSASFDQKILLLQKDIATLGDELQKVSGESKSTVVSLSEVERRQNVRVKSQDELVTDAVSKVVPSVVSIVVSKDVPQLEITYQNPFGNDPFFKDFGFQVPVYQQKGTKHQKVGAGSGFIVSSKGYIVTNKHVVTDQAADYTVLLSNGKQLPAKVVYRDSADDVAVIKIEGSYSSVQFGNSELLKPGQSVVAIGNALGEFNNSVSVGIISGLNRTIQAGGNSGGAPIQLTGVIQTDAAINPGNSGGPLIDLTGKVIGVNVATVLGSSNISFSIPTNKIKAILDKVVK